MTDESEEKKGAPFVVLEHLHIASQELVRVVGVTRDELEAHKVAEVMADAGLRIWLVDLWGDEDGPKVERYVGAPGAVWLYQNGQDPTARGAGEKLTEAGE